MVKRTMLFFVFLSCAVVVSASAGENAVVFMDDGMFGRAKKEDVELNASTGHIVSYPGGDGGASYGRRQPFYCPAIA